MHNASKAIATYNSWLGLDKSQVHMSCVTFSSSLDSLTFTHATLNRAVKAKLAQVEWLKFCLSIIIG